jgi:hypothetical protein
MRSIPAGWWLTCPSASTARTSNREAPQSGVIDVQFFHRFTPPGVAVPQAVLIAEGIRGVEVEPPVLDLDLIAVGAEAQGKCVCAFPGHG